MYSDRTIEEKLKVMKRGMQKGKRVGIRKVAQLLGLLQSVRLAGVENDIAVNRSQANVNSHGIGENSKNWLKFMCVFLQHGSLPWAKHLAILIEANHLIQGQICGWFIIIWPNLVFRIYIKMASHLYHRTKGLDHFVRDNDDKAQHTQGHLKNVNIVIVLFEICAWNKFGDKTVLIHFIMVLLKYSWKYEMLTSNDEPSVNLWTTEDGINVGFQHQISRMESRAWQEEEWKERGGGQLSAAKQGFWLGNIFATSAWTSH